MQTFLSQKVKEQAKALGFSLAGIVEARPGRRLEEYLRWLANAFHGEMGYLARPDRLARRQDLNVILPGVKSVVCVAMDYASAGPPAEFLNDPSRGRIASYAWGDDYHQVMLPRLETLGRWLAEEAGGEVAHRVYVDTGAILERDHAETAGLGFTGKNTMIIGPRRGSWLFLGELLTTVELAPDAIERPLPGCGRCSRCLDACPTDAFPEPYLLDARRCISYLTIELKGWIPLALRPMMGNWVYGCDVCQLVCPFNRFAPSEIDPAYVPAKWERTAPALLDLLRLSESAFASRYQDSPIKRIKRERLVRNACVAAGNWGSEEALPALKELLRDGSALVRGHAAWAIGRIGNGEVEALLRRAWSKEQDDRVRQEAAQALDHLIGA